MTDRLKDNEDKKLESWFGSDIVPDDGFSLKVMSRIKRRMWIRRLSLPAAFIIGSVIALKPLSQLVVTFSKFLTLIPTDVGAFSLDNIPQASTVFLGAILLAAMVMITKMLED